MPSRRRSSKRPYGTPPDPLDVDRALGGARLESGPDGDWNVRTVRSSDKTYTCPGCRQDVPPRTEHVVAWARDALLGPTAAVEDRRHWHTGCWRARSRRR